MRILTLCGSLRAQSSHRAVLHAFACLMPEGTRVKHYTQLAGLPHFNPDLDTEPLIPAVRSLRNSVTHADVLVLSTPEYVHALPGSFKNALDWLVSDPAFAGKPVAILHADRGSPWALAALREILATMSARVIEPAVVLLPLGTQQLTEETILERPDLRALLLGCLQAIQADVAAHAGTVARPEEPT